MNIKRNALVIVEMNMPKDQQAEIIPWIVCIFKI